MERSATDVDADADADADDFLSTKKNRFLRYSKYNEKECNYVREISVQ